MLDIDPRKRRRRNAAQKKEEDPIPPTRRGGGPFGGFFFWAILGGRFWGVDVTFFSGGVGKISEFLRRAVGCSWFSAYLWGYLRPNSFEFRMELSQTETITIFLASFFFIFRFFRPLLLYAFLAGGGAREQDFCAVVSFFLLPHHHHTSPKDLKDNADKQREFPFFIY